jgi:hypothetical protein
MRQGGSWVTAVRLMWPRVLPVARFEAGAGNYLHQEIFNAHEACSSRVQLGGWSHGFFGSSVRSLGELVNR